MKRNIIWLLGAGTLAYAAPALSQSATTATSSAAVERQGILTVTGSYVVNKAIPNGTDVSITVATSITDLVYADNNQVSPSVKVTGGKVSFKVSLPYTWLVKSASDQVSVTIQMSASPNGGVTSYYYSNYDSKTIAIPKNGAITAVAFEGSL